MLVLVLDRTTSLSLINHYKMYGIFGKPGSGKSTMLTKIAYQHAQRGWEVYTNDPSISAIENIKYFDDLKFKRGEWIPDGHKGHKNEYGEINEENRKIVLIIDEIGSLYNNREFKTNLNEKTLRFWAEHRHRNVKIYYGSQSYKDMDLKIRQKTDILYIIKRGFFKNFSVAKPILIDFDIHNNDQGENTGGQIIEKYAYDIIFFWKFIYLKKWIKKFDSYR